MLNGTIVGNISSCLVCLAYGFSWVLHDTGIQDCWTQCDDQDRMISCTKPGQSCDIFYCVSNPVPDVYDYIEVTISITVGLILHYLFLWAQQKIAILMVNRENHGGWRGLLIYLLFAVCCRGRFARDGNHVPLARDEEEEPELPPVPVVPAINPPQPPAAIQAPIPLQPALMDASTGTLERALARPPQPPAVASTSSTAQTPAPPKTKSTKSRIPVSTPITQPSMRQAARNSELQTKKLFKDGRA